jgi:hypothetical protein
MQPESLVVGPIDGPVLPLATGAPFPQAATVRAYISDDRLVTLRLRVRAGRPALVGLTIGTHDRGPKWAPSLERDAPEVTAAEVRALAVDRLVSSAVRAVALAVADATPAPFRYDGEAAATAALGSRRRRAMTEALLREGAAIAQAYPETAIAEVRRQLYCSERTAYRWISEARGRGLLGAKGAK